jgi:predicted DNA-binding transcriptional regulator YafY
MISLLEHPQVVRLSHLFEKTPFRLLYGAVSQRTALRDLQKLETMGLLTVDGKDYSLNHGVLG